jgi:rhodanese-related sulfurtransferase
MKSITVHELQARSAAGEKLRLLDVRTPLEYARVHVPGTQLEPLESLETSRVAAQGPLSPETPLYVLCQSGVRAKKAIGQLEAAGLGHCILVEGGTQAWVNAGFPVERGQVGGISIERQVRIIAGALGLTGTLLGALLHVGFLVIPAVVGAGLLFAGLTDKCGMALVLARMPWNQLSSTKSGASSNTCATGKCCS